MLMWILIGVSLLVLEILTTSFFIVFFGLGALTIALCMLLFSFSLSYQIVGFALVSCLYFALFRNLLKRKKRELITDYELIGAIGIVEEEILPHLPGKIMIGDVFWKASSAVRIQKGLQVKVLSQHNLTVEVKPL